MLTSTLPEAVRIRHRRRFESYIERFKKTASYTSDGRIRYQLHNFSDLIDYRSDKSESEDILYLNAFTEMIPLIVRVSIENAINNGHFSTYVLDDIVREGLSRVFIHGESIPVGNNIDLNIKTYFDKHGNVHHYLLNSMVNNVDRRYLTHIIAANGGTLSKEEIRNLSDKLIFHVDKYRFNIITINHSIELINKGGIYIVTR